MFNTMDQTAGVRGEGQAVAADLSTNVYLVRLEHNGASVIQRIVL